MPTSVYPEVSFLTQMQLREHVLAWISRDCGLVDFLIPDLLTSTWTDEQKQAWTNCIVDKFLRVSREDGKRARRNILTCELAGGLRRNCFNLKQKSVTYREIMKTAVAMESLWNDVSPELDDATWAKCSRLFDVALTSLRVSYVWMYVKTESREQEMSLETRKSVFQTLVNNFFQPDAPTDEVEDKHSTNFRDLLDVWKSDFNVILQKVDFDEALKKLEQTNDLDATATCIEKFLDAVDVDDSWILRMHTLERDLVQGKLVAKDSDVGKLVSKVQRKKKKPSTFIFKPDPDPYESASSQEPKQHDTDYDVDNDNDTNEETMSSQDGRDQQEEDPYVHAQIFTTRRPKQVQMVRDARMRGAAMPTYADNMREGKVEEQKLEEPNPSGDEDELDEQNNLTMRMKSAAAVKLEQPATPPSRRRRPSQPTRVSPRKKQEPAAQASGSGSLVTRRRKRASAGNTIAERKADQRRVSPRLAGAYQKDNEMQDNVEDDGWTVSAVQSGTVEERELKRRRITAAVAADMSQSTGNFSTEHRRESANGK